MKPRFDLAALKELAGGTVYGRGESYHRDGLVTLVRIDFERVAAQVAGTEDYHVTLAGRGKNIDGSCSCPAFDDWGFCKHLVATALAANEAGPGVEAATDDAVRRIRAYLTHKGVDALVAMVMDLAEADPALFRKLDLAASAASADEKTLEARLRKAIDQATRTRDFIDYREASGWAAGVGEALDALNEISGGPRAAIALRLALHAVERIEKAIENIDDSDGLCGDLLARGADIHLAAARVVRPEPIALARDLFAREMAEEYDAFAGVVLSYTDVLGRGGLAEYRRLAHEAWEKLPPRTAGRKRDDYDAEYDRLAGMIDWFAELDGDLDARIVLRAKDLSSSWRYVQLAEFCRANNRHDDALR
jgi:hypothetical protein